MDIQYVGEGSVSWATGLVEPPMFPRKLQQWQSHGTTEWLNMLLEHGWCTISAICHNGQQMRVKSMVFDFFRNIWWLWLMSTGVWTIKACDQTLLSVHLQMVYMEEDYLHHFAH